MTIHSAPPGDHLVGSFAPIPPTLPPYRLALEAEIERMIEMLDALDGDPDLEPSLGGETVLRLDAAGAMLAEVDLEGGDDDREPSLGSFDRMLNQENWSRSTGWHGLGEDRELDDCDREDGGDTEANGDELDYSDHPAGDGGIGDLAGLAEQSGNFDAMASEDEPDFGHQPYSAERAATTRRMRWQMTAKAEALRRRADGLPPISSSAPRSVAFAGPDGRLYSATAL